MPGISTDPEDLDAVIGGWNDARKPDAIAKTRNIFSAINQPELAGDIWSPYNRTSFVKVKLNFPGPGAHISVKRHLRTTVIQKLKSVNFIIGIPGCEGEKLWTTKSKTPEERTKVRAGWSLKLSTGPHAKKVPT